MKTIYIHIGAHKTGTTAIQKFLSLNRGSLSIKGYLYPGIEDQHHFIPHGLQNITSFYTNPKETTKSLISDICKSKYESIILSSEDFSNLINEVPLIKKLFPSDYIIKIILYIRKQDEIIESQYNQSIRGIVQRSVLSFDQYFNITKKKLLFDYYKILLPWREVFGLENIIVKVYEKDQLVGDNLYRDFLQTIGLEFDKTYQIPKNKINVSFQWDLIEIIRLCNFQYEKDKKFHIYLRKILSEINLNNESNERHLLSPQQRRDILNLYMDSNEKVAREYLGREDGRLFVAHPPNLDEAWQPYKGINIEKIVPIFVRILYNMDRKYQKKFE